MFITKTSLSRRTVLRGMGATLALPLLDAMVPALTPHGADRRGARRAASARSSCRWASGRATGRRRPPAPASSSARSSSRSRRSATHVTVVSNLDRPLAGHARRQHRHWLTGSAPKRTEAEDFVAGTSLDQIIARQIGQDTVFPSLEIGTEDFTGYVGACDVGYSCAYMNTISWKSPTHAAADGDQPARGVRADVRPARARRKSALQRMRQNRSILDSVTRRRRRRSSAGSARATACGSTSTSSTCARSKAASSAPRSRRRRELTLPEAPVGIPDSWEEHATVMFDLMALAYEADLTRVFTFMLNREASQLVFPNLGFNEPWHHVSHHGNEPEKLALLVKLNTWQIELFGKFLERLQDTPDGDGTLLDHSVMLWGSGMSDSNTHSPLDVPLPDGGQGRRRLQGQPPPGGAEGHAARQRDADGRRRSSAPRSTGSASAPARSSCSASFAGARDDVATACRLAWPRGSLAGGRWPGLSRRPAPSPRR